MLLVKLVEVEYAGRLKEMKGKIQKASGKEEQDEQAGAVDQIKKKYGFSYSNVSTFNLALQKPLFIHLNHASIFQSDTAGNKRS